LRPLSRELVGTFECTFSWLWLIAANCAHVRALFSHYACVSCYLPQGLRLWEWLVTCDETFSLRWIYAVTTDETIRTWDVCFASYSSVVRSGTVNVFYFNFLPQMLIISFVTPRGLVMLSPTLRKNFCPEGGGSMMMMMMTMFYWVLVPCRLVGSCHRFGEAYCLHLQGWSWRVSMFWNHTKMVHVVEKIQSFWMLKDVKHMGSVTTVL
jgi:hypothetical protein